MTLEGIFPSSEQIAVLQGAGWTLVSTSGVMAATKPGRGYGGGPEALAAIRAEQAAAAKNGRR